MNYYYVLTGLLAGMLAGVFGVGGGLIVVPALVLLFGLTQEVATGTSLIALLAPIGLGGVYAFYQAGKIGPSHIKIGLLISLGMFFGSYFGARFALTVSELTLKRMFSIYLFVVAVKYWLSTM